MYLRLTYALTYASIQGRTIRNKHICLLDASHPKFFTTRHLIVGVSRATHSHYVHAPTSKDEKAIMRNANRNASLQFSESIENQEHMNIPKTPEEDIDTSVTAGSSSCVIQSLITPTTEVQNSALAGAARLQCKPCFNTLMATEQTCIFCNRTREEIAASQ